MGVEYSPVYHSMIMQIMSVLSVFLLPLILQCTEHPPTLQQSIDCYQLGPSKVKAHDLLQVARYCLRPECLEAGSPLGF